MLKRCITVVPTNKNKHNTTHAHKIHPSVPPFSLFFLLSRHNTIYIQYNILWLHHLYSTFQPHTHTYHIYLSNLLNTTSFNTFIIISLYFKLVTLIFSFNNCVYRSISPSVCNASNAASKLLAESMKSLRILYFVSMVNELVQKHQQQKI